MCRGKEAFRHLQEAFPKPVSLFKQAGNGPNHGESWLQRFRKLPIHYCSMLWVKWIAKAPVANHITFQEWKLGHTLFDTLTSLRSDQYHVQVLKTRRLLSIFHPAFGLTGHTVLQVDILGEFLNWICLHLQSSIREPFVSNLQRYTYKFR